MKTAAPRFVGVAAIHGERIRRLRAWGGLAGFAATLALGLRSGAPLGTACLRAVAAGVVASTVAWAAAVTVFRHVVRARLRALTRR